MPSGIAASPAELDSERFPSDRKDTLQSSVRRRRMGCGGSNAAGTVLERPAEDLPKQGDRPNPDGSGAQAAAKAGFQHPLTAPLCDPLQAHDRALLAANEGAPNWPSNEPRTKIRMQGGRLAISNIDTTELAARQLDARRQLNIAKATVLRRRRTSFAEVHHIRSWLNPNPSTPGR